MKIKIKIEEMKLSLPINVKRTNIKNNSAEKIKPRRVQYMNENHGKPNETSNRQ